MNGSILSRIERLEAGKLTRSQRIMLEYFGKVDFKQIMYMSITDLAEATGLAEATVLRFCRSLGFNGYQEFKLRLAQDNTDVRGRESGGGYVADIMEDYRAAIDNCRANILPEQMEKVFEYILSARSICCFGVGHSYLAALELHNRLMKMGIVTFCERDTHFQSILISSRSPLDLLIVFSISGATKDVVEAAELARAYGMKIIVVTCYEKSPLTRFADIILSATSMESPVEPGAMSSKIMQLFMVDVICTGVHLTDKSRFDGFIAKSNVATAGKLI